LKSCTAAAHKAHAFQSNKIIRMQFHQVLQIVSIVVKVDEQL